MDSLDKFSLKYIYNLLTFYFKGMISYVGNTLTIQNPKYTNYIIPIGYNQQVFRRETLKNCTCVFRINWKNLFIAAFEIYTIILMFPWIRNFSQLYEVTGEYSFTLFMSFIKKVGIILLAFIAIKIITSKNVI